MRKRGFTLVELLVVIGIIALLISILLPALGKAREAAKGATCMSNLRQIGQAFFLYNSEGGKFYPPNNFYNTLESKSVTWFNVVMPGTDTRAERVKALYCPNAREYPGPSSAAGINWNISYGFNSCGLGGSDRQALYMPWYATNPGYSQFGKPQRFGSIKNPSGTILAADCAINNDSGALSGVGWYELGTWRQPYHHGNPAPRHGTRPNGPNTSANVLWVDGHVTSVRNPRSNGDPAGMYDRAALGSAPWDDNLSFEYPDAWGQKRL